MKQDWERGDFLSLMGIGGVVFASGLVGCGGAASSGATPSIGASAAGKRRAGEDFFFLQLSDTHWSFKGPPNPQADVTLEHAVATINAVDVQPDFIVFIGDLTRTTDDASERRTRMARFKEIVSALKVKDDLARTPADVQVVVLAHRPLFDLYPPSSDHGLGWRSIAMNEGTTQLTEVPFR
jgi:hypothetical protein